MQKVHIIHKAFFKKIKGERVFRFLASTRTLFSLIKIPGFTVNYSAVHIVQMENSVSFSYFFKILPIVNRVIWSWFLLL